MKLLLYCLKQKFSKVIIIKIPMDHQKGARPELKKWK